MDEIHKRIRFHYPPPVQIGFGKSSVVDKFAAFHHSLRLEQQSNSDTPLPQGRYDRMPRPKASAVQPPAPRPNPSPPATPRPPAFGLCHRPDLAPAPGPGVDGPGPGGRGFKRILAFSSKT